MRGCLSRGGGWLVLWGANGVGVRECSLSRSAASRGGGLRVGPPALCLPCGVFASEPLRLWGPRQVPQAVCPLLRGWGAGAPLRGAAAPSTWLLAWTWPCRGLLLRCPHSEAPVQCLPGVAPPPGMCQALGAASSKPCGVVRGQRCPLRVWPSSGWGARGLAVLGTWQPRTVRGQSALPGRRQKRPPPWHTGGNWPGSLCPRRLTCSWAGAVTLAQGPVGVGGPALGEAWLGAGEAGPGPPPAREHLPEDRARGSSPCGWRPWGLLVDLLGVHTGARAELPQALPPAAGAVGLTVCLSFPCCPRLRMEARGRRSRSRSRKGETPVPLEPFRVPGASSVALAVPS